MGNFEADLTALLEQYNFAEECGHSNEALAACLHKMLLNLAEQHRQEINAIPRYLPLPDWMHEVLKS